MPESSPPTPPSPAVEAWAPSCPLPRTENDVVMLAHGSGGREMRRLIDEVMLAAFAPDGAIDRADSAVLPVDGGRLAFTTDTFVVAPRFFSGGDIGRLAIYGTVNDLAMVGARPRWLSVALVCEEGLPLDELRAVVASMAAAAEACGVRVVTGDTKVVGRGKADGLFITTSGLGEVPLGRASGLTQVGAGDCIVVSGDLGRHGVAVLQAREGLGFECALESDCAPLHHLVEAMFDAGEVHMLRDLTRGGLAAALCEIALDAGHDLEVDEQALPVHPTVRAACELLGLDPAVVANEGRLVAIVPAAAADAVLAAMRCAPHGEGAARIGEVRAPVNVDGGRRGRVTLRSPLAGSRIMDYPRGELLPRIC